MSAIEKWYDHFDFISLLIGAALGMFLSTWHSYFIKRPRLKITGNGSSGGNNFRTTSLNLTNASRFIGLRISPSIMFGKRVHGTLHWGIPVDTLPARNVQATLVDKDSGIFVSQLYWHKNQIISPTIDLDSEEQVGLLVFSRLEQDPTHYFPFRPGPDGVGVDVPQNGGYSDETRKFEVRINYSQARKPLIFQCKVSRQFGGGFWVEACGGGGLL